MNGFFPDTMQKGVHVLYKGVCWRAVKLICLGGFCLGFIVFWILGKDFAESNALLDIDALREVKDAAIDQQAFYAYVLHRRLFWFVLGIVFWWWRLGKYYACFLFGAGAFSMGACMYTALHRYYLKGLFLWIFLYVPQIFCYIGALLCVIWLARIPLHTKEEKWQFLYKNILFLLILCVLFGLGVYLESYVNTLLLQDFLTFF